MDKSLITLLPAQAVPAVAAVMVGIQIIGAIKKLVDD
jgi:hypothetical protein